MFSRDELKTLTDKVLNMVKADAAEIEFSGGALRYALGELDDHDESDSVRSAIDADRPPGPPVGRGIDARLR
jgi:hypothetical protein